MRTHRIVILGVASLVVVACIAGCKPGSAIAPEAPPAGPVGPTALQGGVKLELVAVNGDSAQKSWKPDGTPLEEPVRPTVLAEIGSQVGRPSGTRSFVVRIDGVPRGGMPSLAFRINAGEIRGSGYTTLEDGWNLQADPSQEYWLSGTGPEMIEGRTTNLQVGLALGPWEAVAAYKNDGGKFVHSQGSEFHPFVMPEKKVEDVDAEGQKATRQSFSVTVELPETVKRHAFRLVALDRAGKEMTDSGSFTKSDKTVPSEYYFGGKMSEVDRIELQVRDYTWIVFKNVRLNPN